MRNLRKLTAAVLTVALIFTPMTTVFAADSATTATTTATVANADKAASLKDLGLYAGQDANDPKVGLENALTTQDALIFLAKLFGYNDAANALAGDQVAEALAKFDDAAIISDYAKNVVAYSAENGILSGSTQNGQFFVGAQDTVTAARFATFMLRQMGYTVADYRVSVAQLAETKGSKVDGTLTGDLTRDDAVGVMYGALTAEKASGKTVIADIIGDDPDLKEKAEKAGLISPSDSISDSNSNSDDKGSFYIEAVNVLNLKQLEIKFSTKMDKASAEDKRNYRIKDQGDHEKTLTETSCKLGDDKKTVTITLDNAVQDHLTNISDVTVIVSKNIMSAKSSKLGENKEFKILVQDDQVPTVKEVRATGEKKIRIIFSEPVWESNNNTTQIDTSNFVVSIGENKYLINKAILDLNVINLELDTELLDTELIEKPVTVIVNNESNNLIMDYAQHLVSKDKHQCDYVKDTSVSVVTVKDARKDKVVLAFSKPVKGSNMALYHSSKGAAAYKAMATTAGHVNEITFTFAQALPSGNIHLYLVNSENDDEKLVDSYGIKVPDQTLTCTVVIDTIPPNVKQYDVDGTKSLKIQFNEALNKAVASDAANYVVKKIANGTEIEFKVVLDNSSNSVELQFLNKLEDNTEYKLIIKKLTDTSGNTTTNTEYVFKTLDYAPPRVMDEDCFVLAEKGAIVIIYSEAMNESQMCDKANYMVSLDGGYKYETLVDDDELTRIDDHTIKIILKALKGNQNASTITPYVKIAPIMDLIKGKRLYDSVDAHTVEKIGPQNVCITKAQLTTTNAIKLVFNTKMDTFKVNDIVLINADTEEPINNPNSNSKIIESCAWSIINDDGKTEVLLILNEALATDATYEGARIAISTIDTPASISTYGTQLKGQFSIPLDDKVAPKIVKWDHDNDLSTNDIAKVIGTLTIDPNEVTSYDTVPAGTCGTITIFFSENITNSELTYDTFKVDGFIINDITTQGNTIILDIEAASDDTSVRTTVAQTQDSEDIISDAAGNVFTSYSTWEVTWDCIQ